MTNFDHICLGRTKEISSSPSTPSKFSGSISGSIPGSSIGLKSSVLASTTSFSTCLFTALRLVYTFHRFPLSSSAVSTFSAVLEYHLNSTFLYGTVEDIQEAVGITRQAAQAMPEGHPNGAEVLASLGRNFGLRYNRTRSMQALQESACHLTTAFETRTAPPLLRIQCGHTASGALMGCMDYEGSFEIMASAVRLLPRISPRTLPRDDHQYILAQLSDVSSHAASVGLLIGKPPSDILELIELGHGIIAGLIMDSREDVSRLKDSFPDLCFQYEDLRNEVGSVLTFSEEGTQDRTIERRYDAVRKLEELEQRIRDKVGFERFQLPPSSEELMSLAKDGPIVTFNVTNLDLRSDAIIVTESEIKMVNLPDLKYSEVEKNSALIQKLSKGGGIADCKQRNIDLSKILHWLWDVAVHPVLQALNLESTNSATSLPRVWWVSSGVMGLLPIHAAGIHSKGSSENTLSKVVSSYTTTVRALNFFKYKKTKQLVPKEGKVSIFAMPKTEGNEDLSADEEIEAIIDHIPVETPRSVYALPSKQTVISELERCSIAHFICHGVSDARDPSQGHLLLKGHGETVDRFTVREVSAIHQPQAQIAYLSACSTAENLAEKLKDEVIHLASGFQLAGFSHVVGTLWEVDDDVAPIVASEFYKALGEPSIGALDGGRVANALHTAMKSVRDEDPDEPLR